MLGQIGNVNTESYSIDYAVTSDWGTGFSAEIIITNNSDEDIVDWVLEFDFNREVDNIWNGFIEQHEGDHYIVKNAEYNYIIQPGQSISIGLIGHPENKDTAVFSNARLMGYGFVECVENCIKYRYFYVSF